MYDKIELSSKSQEDLIAIAKELKIKKPESIKAEDLIYVILDEQAVQTNERPARKTKTKKKVVKSSAESKSALVPDPIQEKEEPVKRRDSPARRRLKQRRAPKASRLRYRPPHRSSNPLKPQNRQRPERPGSG